MVIPSVSRWPSVRLPGQPRFHKAPYDPGRPDFPGPVLTLTSFGRLPDGTRLKHWPTYTPTVISLRPRMHGVHRPNNVRLLSVPPSAQSPFARIGCYLLRRGVSRHISEHYPAFIAHTRSCANPKPSRRLRPWPVFAGCCQPLVGVGPSRRCLWESFSACLDPYPGCSCGASARFFPQDNGLPDVMTRSALGDAHTIATSVWCSFRGCSYSIIFRPANLLAPHVAPTAMPLGTRQTGLLHPRIEL